MTNKKIAVGIGIVCLYIFMLAWARIQLASIKPITTTPEPIDLEITTEGGWEYDDMPGSIAFEIDDWEQWGQNDGCVCGEPRDDGRMCDVYVEIITDTMMKVWTDASPEQLEGVIGVEWAEGRAVGRDPRYSWQSIVDGICALR